MKVLLKAAITVVFCFSLTEAFAQWFSEETYQSNYLNGLAGVSEFCGIYQYVATGSSYTIGVVKSGAEFSFYNLTRQSDTWYAGRKKATLKSINSKEFLVDWIMRDGSTTKRCRARWHNGMFVIEGLRSEETFLLKSWPSLEEERAFLEANQSRNWVGNGSGVLFNSMGFVLTNQHVVDGASSVSVVFGNTGQQLEYEAGVVAVDAAIDLALLKITDLAFGSVPAPPFSFQTKTSVGEEIFALGYPMALSGLGAEMKYTNGSVSANSGFNGDMKTMQISVPIQDGNSGGPLFNAQGELIGITNAKIRSDVADNVSYAIKSIFVEAFLAAMPYEVSVPNGIVETENRVDIIDALRPYTCLVLVK